MLFDGKIESEALDILGRCSREESCEAGNESAGGLTRQLHLLNGPLLNRKISASDGRLAKLIAAGKSPAKIVDEFYRRALGRRPFTPGTTILERTNGLRNQPATAAEYVGRFPLEHPHMPRICDQSLAYDPHRTGSGADIPVCLVSNQSSQLQADKNVCPTEQLTTLVSAARIPKIKGEL